MSSPLLEMIESLNREGHKPREIARRVGRDIAFVEATLVDLAARGEEEAAAAESYDDIEIWSPEKIDFALDAMLPKVLDGMKRVISDPDTPAAVMLNASKMIMDVNTAIQNRRKPEGSAIQQEWQLSQKAVAALEMLNGILSGEDWREKVDKFTTYETT